MIYGYNTASMERQKSFAVDKYPLQLYPSATGRYIAYASSVADKLFICVWDVERKKLNYLIKNFRSQYQQ